MSDFFTPGVAERKVAKRACSWASVEIGPPGARDGMGLVLSNCDGDSLRVLMTSVAYRLNDEPSAGVWAAEVCFEAVKRGFRVELVRGRPRRSGVHFLLLVDPMISAGLRDAPRARFAGSPGIDLRSKHAKPAEGDLARFASTLGFDASLIDERVAWSDHYCPETGMRLLMPDLSLIDPVVLMRDTARGRSIAAGLARGLGSKLLFDETMKQGPLAVVIHETGMSGWYEHDHSGVGEWSSDRDDLVERSTDAAPRGMDGRGRSGACCACSDRFGDSVAAGDVAGVSLASDESRAASREAAAAFVDPGHDPAGRRRSVRGSHREAVKSLRRVALGRAYLGMLAGRSDAFVVASMPGRVIVAARGQVDGVGARLYDCMVFERAVRVIGSGSVLVGVRCGLCGGDAPSGGLVEWCAGLPVFLDSLKVRF